MHRVSIGWAHVLFVVTGTQRQAARAQVAADALANNTVLIIHHAEKPEQGRELTALGEARARAYASYFTPFRETGSPFDITALYAGADSDSSIRPRLTLEPLSKADHLRLDTSVGTKEPAALVQLLRSTPHGTYPLICWKHGQIPNLITAFGGDPMKVTPESKWPDGVYDWVIVLKFDAHGKFTTEARIIEKLKVE